MQKKNHNPCLQPYIFRRFSFSASLTIPHEVYTMSSSPSTSTNCRSRSTVRRPSYSIENGDQESLIHALSMGLRRAHYDSNPNGERSPKVSVGASPFSHLASRHNDTRQRSYIRSSEQRRADIASILDEALHVMDGFKTDLPPLNSQASQSSIATFTESDSTEDSSNSSF
jgi:hypothetical protein